METKLKKTGNISIPAITVEGRTIPEVWEKAVIKTWNEGAEMPTEYDKPGDPPSRDCTMMMVVRAPMDEPRIHRAFPGGLEDLEIYKQEVINGIHDHWINPSEGKWTYTYHERLFSYKIEDRVVDQIAYTIDKLSKHPHSRRAQAITWNAGCDPSSYDPPCLQRLWCRISKDSSGKLYLNMNSHWRSRDAYKASFMNIFALTELQKVMAETISANISKPVSCGRYVDISDSFHIYGSYHNDFKGFLETVKARNFGERTWNTSFAEPIFEEARKKLENERG
ncbi:MAG: hypothetical protein AUJ75_00445 [Candidatus Omnitrophica bacterium CG1_02_49_10]|nr:MAG: hypothetical protein AUJ75_00445 [Candidatus Omnitrophica bacterium CG1_02_49_10]